MTNTVKIFRSVDDIITWITEASNDAEALIILRAVNREGLNKVADQLYIDCVGQSVAWLRRAIVKEARS